MLVCPVDAETLAKCEADALARNVSLWQQVPPDSPIPGSSWTVHDVAAHLVTMVGRYINPDRKLASAPRDVDQMNELEMKEFESATMGELVGRLRSRYAKYLAFWSELPLEMVLPLREGLPVDVAALRSNWIAELLVHGRDMALAAGLDWPLDDTNCLLILRLLAQALPNYFRAVALTDCALVVAPDGGAPFTIVIKAGAAEIQAAAVEGADVLAGSPAALVLLFYGRIGLSRALASGVGLTGDADRVQRLLGAQQKP